MPLFRVDGEVTISITTIVRARTAAEAKRKAASVGMTSGLVDAGDERSEWITSSELDGEPKVVGCEPYEGDANGDD